MDRLLQIVVAVCSTVWITIIVYCGGYLLGLW